MLLAELRLEIGEDVELRVARFRDVQIEAVLAAPEERLRAGDALQAVEVDLPAAEDGQIVVREIVADDGHEIDLGKERRRNRKVRRRSAQAAVHFPERSLNRVERDAANDEDAHDPGGGGGGGGGGDKGGSLTGEGKIQASGPGPSRKADGARRGGGPRVPARVGQHVRDQRRSPARRVFRLKRYVTYFPMIGARSLLHLRRNRRRARDDRVLQRSRAGAVAFAVRGRHDRVAEDLLRGLGVLRQVCQNRFDGDVVVRSRASSRSR